MNLVDSRPRIRRQCIICGEMFFPVDSWVCPTCDSARDRQMALSQSKIGGAGWYRHSLRPHLVWFSRDSGGASGFPRRLRIPARSEGI